MQFFLYENLNGRLIIPKVLLNLEFKECIYPYFI